jgi:hypothetical protein
MRRVRRPPRGTAPASHACGGPMSLRSASDRESPSPSATARPAPMPRTAPVCRGRLGRHGSDRGDHLESAVSWADASAAGPDHPRAIWPGRQGNLQAVPPCSHTRVTGVHHGEPHGLQATGRGRESHRFPQQVRTGCRGGRPDASAPPPPAVEGCSHGRSHGPRRPGHIPIAILRCKVCLTSVAGLGPRG